MVQYKYLSLYKGPKNQELWIMKRCLTVLFSILLCMGLPFSLAEEAAPALL